MKHKGNIFIATILSFMVIYWGAGVVLMHCCHTERTTIVSMVDCCKDNCGGPRKKCMQFEMRKLPPSVISDYQSAPQPLLKALAFSKVPLLDCWNYPIFRFHNFWAGNRIKGLPPRAYLSLLTVLII